MNNKIVTLVLGAIISCTMLSVQAVAQCSGTGNTYIAGNITNNYTYSFSTISSTAIGISVQYDGTLPTGAAALRAVVKNGGTIISANPAYFGTGITSGVPSTGTLTLNTSVPSGTVLTIDVSMSYAPVSGDGGVGTFETTFTMGNCQVQTVSLDLQTLTVDGTQVSGFAAATTSYNVTLPYGTTTIPTVAGTALTPTLASVTVVQAQSLPGAATVTVKDNANTSSTKTYTVNFTVSPFNPANNTACSGTTNEVSQGSPLTYSYNFVTTTSGVDITITAIDPSLVGIVGYVWDQTNGFAEIQMAGGGGTNQTVTYTLPYTTAAQIIHFSVKLAFAGGMSVTKQFPYTVGDACTPSNINSVGVNEVYGFVTKDVINVTNLIAGSQIFVYDVSGKLLKEVIAQSNTEQIAVNSNGLFVVKVVAANGTTLLKMIK